MGKILKKKKKNCHYYIAMSIDIQVKFFASCRELTGVNAVKVSAEVKDTSELIALLLEMYPDLKSGIDEVSLAVNKKYIEGPTTLHDNDEVALLPPMSGG